VNIFILNEDPVIAAQEQCDKHVVKMILESAQMLSTAHRILDGSETRMPSKSGKTMSKYWVLPDSEKENLFYKAVHTGHPCTVWTMESVSNYNWHYKHFVALCREYTYRYGKIHKSDKDLLGPLCSPPKNISKGRLTPFKLAMGVAPECMFPDRPVESYQKFYQTKQERFKMIWTKRDIPGWFTTYANI